MPKFTQFFASKLNCAPGHNNKLASIIFSNFNSNALANYSLLFRNRKMLGEIFSVTNLVSVAFLAYMGNSVFTLGKFWFPETCPEGADFDGKAVIRVVKPVN